VDELGDRAGANRADIGRLVADRVEHPLEAVEDLLVTADPDRHLAAGRTRGPAADRRIEQVARPTSATMKAIGSFAVIESATRTAFDSRPALAYLVGGHVDGHEETAIG
jgi:hypothetical protein